MFFPAQDGSCVSRLLTSVQRGTFVQYLGSAVVAGERRLEIRARNEGDGVRMAVAAGNTSAPEAYRIRHRGTVTTL